LDDFVIAETAPSVPEQTPGSHPATVGEDLLKFVLTTQLRRRE
jgi:hypothetical protein